MCVLVRLCVFSFGNPQISKDDYLPKKICERCILRLEQFYEWKAICVQSDTVLRNYSESMRAVTASINFQVRKHFIRGLF